MNNLKTQQDTSPLGHATVLVGARGTSNLKVKIYADATVLFQNQRHAFCDELIQKPRLFTAGAWHRLS